MKVPDPAYMQIRMYAYLIKLSSVALEGHVTLAKMAENYMKFSLMLLHILEAVLTKKILATSV